MNHDNKIESASFLYINTCSCMVNYLAQGLTYIEHLKKDHLKIHVQ